MMTQTFILLLFSLISLSCNAQIIGVIESSKYVLHIDSLLTTGKIDTVSYEDMSYCGGSLEGYYYNSNLVYISSTYSAEAGYSEENIYIKDGEPIKIIYHMHFAEWEKYYLKYPEGEGEYGDTYENMTYTDTTYHIYVLERVMQKYSGAKFNNDIFNPNVFNNCINCYKSMFLELNGKREEAIELRRSFKAKKSSEVEIIND